MYLFAPECRSMACNGAAGRTIMANEQRVNASESDEKGNETFHKMGSLIATRKSNNLPESVYRLRASLLKTISEKG